MAVRIGAACLKWGFKLNARKTKSMCTSKELQKMETPFSGEIIELVSCFTHLGGSDNTIYSELDRKKVNACSDFNNLGHSVFTETCQFLLT